VISLAKATITLTDLSDGNICLSVEYDPPVEDDDEGTLAQQAAAAMCSDMLLQCDHEDLLPEEQN
jgi:hypothetical protein